MLDTETSDSFGYCAARAAGGLLFCSGQIGLEADGSVPEAASRQFDLAFAALAETLEQNGCATSDIVDLTSFHVGYPAHMEEFAKAKAAFLDGATCCWTAIGVASLGYPGSLVEIKAVAARPVATSQNA